MWDGRAAALEEQALGPLQADAEMNMPLPVLMDRVARISEYQPLFDAVFPGDGTNPKHLAKAMATYERTVASGPAPFDAWLDGHCAGDRRGGGADQAHSRCDRQHGRRHSRDQQMHRGRERHLDRGRGSA
jgi:cytochrome c peroxidase